MSHARQQGMLGQQQVTLHGSQFAMGPNHYLSSADFFKMLLLAMAAHALVFLFASLMPAQKVTEIPVQALNFRLGDGERVAPLPGVGVEMEMTPEIAPPAMQATDGEVWSATPNTPAPVVPPPLRPVAKKNPVQQKAQPVKPPMIAPVPEEASRIGPVENPSEPAPAVPPVANGLPNPALLAQPAIAPNPQQYVREVGAAPVGNAPAAPASAGQVVESQAVQAVRARYEQQISGWIQMHKYYPANAGGARGRAVVRMQIDRTGAVRYYAIEKTSGNPIIDAAAVDMIRRANPVPAVPADYPAGSLIEFLIPLSFAP